MPVETAAPNTSWCLYLLECQSGAYYAGITNDLEKRYAAHVSGKGAKYTRANPPVRVLAVAPFADRSAASKAEWLVKQAPRHKKLQVVHSLIDALRPSPSQPSRPSQKG